MNRPLNDDPNIQMLMVIVEALGDLCDSLVFIGGCATGLLVTSVRAQTIRPTRDVDVVAQVVSRHEYHELERKVEARGFAHDLSEDAPICRWVRDDIKLDLMPSEIGVLGFHNIWYPRVMDTAFIVSLPNGKNIRLISAPAFIATKLEAFKDRGEGDFLLSHDLEDIVTVIDGRNELLQEIEATEKDMRDYICDEISVLLEKPEFMQSLSGHLPGDAISQARLPVLIDRLEDVAGLKEQAK